MTLLVFLALLLSACAKTGEQSQFHPDGTLTVFEFRPGVIVDAARRSAYLMNVDRGIDAVDLGSGDLIWRTDQAAKPLWRHGDRLAAQTEPQAGRRSLRIALLNTGAVAEAPRFVDIPLPEGVQATVDDGMESSFGATVRTHEGAFLLSWRYANMRVTGPPPDPEQEASPRTASGNVLIDVRTGQFELVEELATPREPELPAAVTRFRDAQAAAVRVWRVNDVLVVVERTTHESKQRVALKRWDADSGNPLADVVLFEGGLSFRAVSEDERHLLASRRHESDPRFWEWVIYSLETGEKAAEIRQVMPSASFFLSGSSLIHETPVTSRKVNGQEVFEPGRLRAIDLDTGTEIWSRAIRDTKYRGPYPSRRR